MRDKRAMNPTRTSATCATRQPIGRRGPGVLDLDEPDGRRQLETRQDRHSELSVTGTFDTPPGGSLSMLPPVA